MGMCGASSGFCASEGGDSQSEETKVFSLGLLSNCGNFSVFAEVSDSAEGSRLREPGR